MIKSFIRKRFIVGQYDWQIFDCEFQKLDTVKINIREHLDLTISKKTR